MEGSCMRRNRRGFTLAELLIVVAIIAVLVAISIPIFTSQLEKSRESVDLANARSLYAEVMTAAASDDSTAAHDGHPIKQADGTFSAAISPLIQKESGWSTNMENVSIGGVSSGDAAHWKGSPEPGGSCTVTYDPQNYSVTITWSGTAEGGSGPADPETPPAEDAEAAHNANTGTANSIGAAVLALMESENKNNGQMITVTVRSNGTCSVEAGKNGSVNESMVKTALINANLMDENGRVAFDPADTAAGYTITVHNNNGGHNNKITVTPLNG